MTLSFRCLIVESVIMCFSTQLSTCFFFIHLVIYVFLRYKLSWTRRQEAGSGSGAYSEAAGITSDQLSPNLAVMKE